MFQFEVDPTDFKNFSLSNVRQSPSSENFKEDIKDRQDIDFKLGEGIICDDYFGVVRYIGRVGKYPGLWLGIEWENPERGKHSGTVDNVKYFSTVKPNSASFIRPQRAQRPLNVNIMSAVQERYGFQENLTINMKQIDNRLETKRVKLSELKILDLHDLKISELGKAGELAERCPKVEYISLADNYIKLLKNIVELCINMKYLQRLDISSNPFTLSNELEEYYGAFPRLQHLIMGKLGFEWEDILKVSYLAPNLTNLQVPFNKIIQLSPPENTLANLTSIDLEGNKITSWDEILKLNILQNLEYMNLCGNLIKSVKFPKTSCEEMKYFSKLESLNISENEIGNWESINELNKISSLKNLRIETNPLFQVDSKANNRQMIIAKIENLKKLEGTEILRKERRDSEVDYLKNFVKLWTAENDSSQFEEMHPRYKSLNKKWGQADIGEVADHVPTSMKTGLISLKLIPEDTSYPAQTKKILSSMTISKLKVLLQRMFKIRSNNIGIIAISSKNSKITFPLENDFSTLSQYSVEENDELIVKW